MRLLTVLVSYNRLELLKETVRSYRETVTLKHQLMIVDNGSDPETIDWLMAAMLSMPDVEVRYLNENRYPGFATNFGWQAGLVNHSYGLLHRSDNDVEYLPGWCEEVERMFAAYPVVGQLGLRTLEEEGPHAAVGGNCVLRSEVFAAGVRYREEPWGAIVHEDGYMSQSVVAAGYGWARVENPCIVHRGIADMNDPYYQETMRVRGITL